MRKLSKSAWVLIGILILGAFFRFYSITEIPPGLYPDEAMNGNNALEAIATGNWKMFYPENNGREGLFINIQALSIWLFGNEPWALRVVSALFGTLTILGVYLLTKELFQDKSQTTSTKSQISPNDQNLKSQTRISNFGFRIWNLFEIWNLEFGISRGEIVALLSSFFLATSYWHINFSRIGFRAITIPFFSAFGIYWLLKGLRTGKISSIALAGIFIGLGFHTYIAFRFIPFVLAVPLVFALARWQREKNQELGIKNQGDGRANHNSLFIIPNSKSCIPCAIILFLFITFVVALPIGWYFLQNPADFFGRGGQVSVFATERPIYEFTKSNLLTLQMFFWQGDCNPRHNFSCQPELHPLVGIFFAIGIIFTIKTLFKSQTASTKSQINPNDQKPKSQTRVSNFEFWSLFGVWDLEFGISRSASLLLLFWFFIMTLPATLTREGLPHALRAIGTIPPVMIFAGIGAAWLWRVAATYLENSRQNPAYVTRANQLGRIKKEVLVLAALLLCVITLQTGKTYFFRFPSSPETYFAFATDFLHMGKYLNSLPVETPKYILTNLSGTEVRGIPMPAQTVMFITDTFRQESQIMKHVTYLTSESLASTILPPDAIIIPLNANRETIRLLKTQFPSIRFSAPGDFIIGIIKN